ncbi:MAG: glycosyltransferase family 4 protein, partial [Myxococcota bacterium]
MASPCRILVLNERDPLHPSAGGAEVHLSEVFGRLAARGYEVVVAASSFPGASLHECVNGLRVRRLGGLARYYPRVAWTCARETRRGAFDLVIENFNKVPFFAPLYAGAPVLVLCHHLFGRVAFRQTAWPLAAAVFGAERCVPLVYRRCQFVAVSESSRSDLVRRGIAEPLIRVIHNGVSPCSVPVDTTRVRSGRIAYVGRLEPYKRIDLVLRAFASVKNRFSAAELVVIGRGKARAKLERLARELGLEGRARFTGFVSDRTRDELLAGSRLAVCASPKEGWGITVIEA